MNPDVIEFRSGEPRLAVIGGIGFGVMAINGLLKSDDAAWWFSLALAVAAVYQFRKAIRTWKVPAVRLTSGDLQVFAHGRIAHYIPWVKIQSVETGFNTTILRLDEGVSVPVKSTEFLWGSEVDAFRSAIQDRLKSQVTAS